MKTLRQALRSIGKATPCAVPRSLETRWHSKSLKDILQRMYAYKPADIAYSQSWIDPAIPDPMKPFKVWFRFCNIGKDSTGSFKIRRELDGGAQHSDVEIANCNPGACDAVVWDFPQGLPAGDHYVDAYFDYESKVLEWNRTNNHGTLRFSVVQKLPDIKYLGCAMEPTFSPAAGEPFRVLFYFGNVGNAPTGSFKVRLILDNGLKSEDIAAPSYDPGAGDFAFWTFPSGLSAGNHWIYAYFDWEGKVAEWNKGNNIGYIGFSVWA